MKVPLYNTSEGKVNLPEYGRNIQKMVEHAISIPDQKERQRCANHIINIMGNLFPHLRNVDDFKHKLWDHLAIISNYKLDIDYPYPIESLQETKKKSPSIPYQYHKIRYPQYGYLAEELVNKILQEENPNRQTELVRLTLFQMKKIYQTWNRDNVEDEIIINDLRYMTNDQVKIPNIELRIEVPKNNNKRKNKH